MPFFRCGCIRDWCAFFLILLLAFPSSAQVQPPAQTDTPNRPTGLLPSLKINVLQGAGSVNNIRTGAVTPPVVEVRDDNDRPVEGADVVFRLPAVGPGGFFADQRSSFRTRTNSQGQAACPRFTPSSQPGAFQIQVTVTLENKLGQIAIPQTNSPDTFSTEAPVPKKSRKWLWIALAGGGAATATILALTLGGDSDSGSNTYTVTPGGITVGPPR